MDGFCDWFLNTSGIVILPVDGLDHLVNIFSWTARHMLHNKLHFFSRNATWRQKILIKTSLAGKETYPAPVQHFTVRLVMCQILPKLVGNFMGKPRFGFSHNAVLRKGEVSHVVSNYALWSWHLAELPPPESLLKALNASLKWFSGSCKPVFAPFPPVLWYSPARVTFSSQGCKKLGSRESQCCARQCGWSCPAKLEIKSQATTRSNLIWISPASPALWG